MCGEYNTGPSGCLKTNMVTSQFQTEIYLRRIETLRSNLTENTIIPNKDQVIKVVEGKIRTFTILYRVIILFGL